MSNKIIIIAISIAVMFICGCMTQPPADLQFPVVTQKVIHQSWAENKIFWMGGHDIHYQEIHPFIRYITVVGVDHNSTTNSFSFLVDQDVYDKNRVGYSYVP